MTSYALSALDREIALVRSASPGARNATLHRAAYALGGLIASGALDAREAESALVTAGIEAGLPEREARAVARRSLRRGADHPRVLPDRDPRRGRIPARPPTPGRIVLPNYPPSDELRDLIARSLPVTDNRFVVEWLRSRGLDPEAVELWHLGRALPQEGPLPAWARCMGRDWRESSHRVLLPIYDTCGALRSVKARAIRADTETKELAPAGYSTGGLVFACVMGRRVLAGDVPDWWTPTILIVEGGPDFLTWAMRQRDSTEDGLAVLGIGAGSWTDEIAARIPDDATVYLRGHEGDGSGRGYMDKIEATLATRCRVYRRRTA